jgi:M-phase inducer tyrosine phosphatase
MDTTNLVRKSSATPHRVSNLLLAPVSAKNRWHQVLVIDARSKSEYTGGHIHGAVNCLHDRDSVEQLYAQVYNPDTLFVFHCEFSWRRGPTPAQQFMDIHKPSENASQPLMIVVMDEGFISFYQSYQGQCDGEYWPEDKLDPAKQENQEFLRHVHTIVGDL